MFVNKIYLNNVFEIIDIIHKKDKKRKKTDSIFS